mmetsp:Transcript_17017/g.54254  ORF Transcript_17017/g.54254 Transcript_17017/m.54254 type:complete len:289 (-) Transcript_17017:12009-12875(-)
MGSPAWLSLAGSQLVTSMRLSMEVLTCRAVCCRSALRNVMGWYRWLRSRGDVSSASLLQSAYHPSTACILRTTACIYLSGSSGPSHKLSHSAGISPARSEEPCFMVAGESISIPRMTFWMCESVRSTSPQIRRPCERSIPTNVVTGGAGRGSGLKGSRYCGFCPMSVSHSLKSGASRWLHSSRSNRLVATLLCAIWRRLAMTASELACCAVRSMLAGRVNRLGRSTSGRLLIKVIKSAWLLFVGTIVLRVPGSGRVRCPPCETTSGEKNDSRYVRSTATSKALSTRPP